MNYAMKNDYISKNVAQLVELPEEPDTMNEFGEIIDKTDYFAFSQDERVLFLKQAEISSSRSSVYVTLLTMLYTGLRVGEALALKWRNVNLKRGEIYVRENYQRVKTPEGPMKTKLVVGPPKTTAGRRAIPLPKFLIEELKNIRKNKKKTRKNGVKLIMIRIWSSVSKTGIIENHEI